MDEDPFEVTAKVVDSMKNAAKTDKTKGISPDPVSSYVEQEESATATGHTASEGRPGLTVSEQVDDMIDQSIEIESNKKMIRENVKWFPLTFTSRDMEQKVSLMWKVLNRSLERHDSNVAVDSVTMLLEVFFGCFERSTENLSVVMAERHFSGFSNPCLTVNVFDFSVVSLR